MSRWGFTGDVDAWRLAIAEQVGDGSATDVLDAVGRDWSTPVETRLPRGPGGDAR